MEPGSFFRGFGIGFGLIAAIGSQNAYVLTRGILRNYHWTVALLGSCIDVALIVLGVAGMGKLVQEFPAVITWVTLGGAVFLLLYGALAFRNVFRSAALRQKGGLVTRRQAILAMLALTLLNPHVYLDTVVLLGSISIQEPEGHEWIFALGAICASFVWFFCLALGGQWMQGWFKKPFTWKILDTVICIVMWSIAYSLLNRLI